MIKGILLIAILCFTTVSFAQVFGKGEPGYVILEDGTSLDGFVKDGNYTNKIMTSVRYSETVDGDYKLIKLKKKVSSYFIDGHLYTKASIKMGLFGGRKDRFCGVAFDGETFTVINHPEDDFKTTDGSELNVKTMFYVKKKGDKDFKMITVLAYSKNMKKLCGDSDEWNAKVDSEPKWLSFSNRVENFKFYEEASSKL